MEHLNKRVNCAQMEHLNKRVNCAQMTPPHILLPLPTWGAKDDEKTGNYRDEKLRSYPSIPAIHTQCDRAC